jgi:hypothetical protein
MDALTFESIKTAAVVLLILFSAVGTIGKGLEVITGFRRPHREKEATTAQKLEEHRQMLDNDKRRLDAHEAQLGEIRRMNQMQCVGMKALLSHEINGNSIDKLKTANDQLDAYLIGVGK